MINQILWIFTYKYFYIFFPNFYRLQDTHNLEPPLILDKECLLKILPIKRTVYLNLLTTNCRLEEFSVIWESLFIA